MDVGYRNFSGVCDDPCCRMRCSCIGLAWPISAEELQKVDHQRCLRTFVTLVTLGWSVRLRRGWDAITCLGSIRTCSTSSVAQSTRAQHRRCRENSDSVMATMPCCQQERSHTSALLGLFLITDEKSSPFTASGLLGTTQRNAPRERGSPRGSRQGSVRRRHQASGVGRRH
jgi:hypothetical protein